MITGVEIGRRAIVLPLGEVALGHGIRRIPELQLLLAQPDDFSGRLDLRDTA